MNMKLILVKRDDSQWGRDLVDEPGVRKARTEYAEVDYIKGSRRGNLFAVYAAGPESYCDTFSHFLTPLESTDTALLKQLDEVTK